MARQLTIKCTKRAGGARFVDGGRPGYRSQGIPSGGPADRAAAEQVNRLLGQSPSHPSLEFTLAGGRWKLVGEGQLALAGADMDWRLNDRPIDRARVIDVTGESVLAGGFARDGCRSYLGIRGEWEVPTLLGSIEPGLPGTEDSFDGYSWSVRSRTYCEARWEEPGVYREGEPCLINAVPGPEWELLDRERQMGLINKPLMVHPDSNRQGIRFHRSDRSGGAIPPLLSSPVLPGTVQFTPSGAILLGPDAQTVGGYPRALVVVDDLSPAFQLRPGQTVRFRVDL
ncbi:biotin-dependent carboxyltransferase family protein [Lewinella sp. IMCC34191]|uniref:5-oxoprolinase subunit C family protein n=1 Tax=Lewinella sp. IMCC34191 TaxID=2259172 RepID=UPI000E260B95|nr:biotin-dependent carboxyltransferase family protein [Lewinella sp. IMCC34191]